MGRQYDPWAHAHELGLTVIEAELPDRVNGEYRHAQRLVVLRAGLSQRAARCALAHEVQHALAGDEPTMSLALHRKAEVRAARRAAWMLVDPYEYAEAERDHDGHVPSMAHALNVTVRVLRDWQAMLRMVAA